MSSKKHIAPDGGWGWVVVGAYALNNVVTIPIYQGFTLIFRNIFKVLEMGSTDISVILNLNMSFGMILGLGSGSLIKNYGFRRVALISSMLSCFGFFLTSFANSFMEFIIFYGIINSAGFVAVMLSFSVAQNTYFAEKRSRASGICMTVTGLGPIFMPLLISFLMREYGARGACLVLSALSLHSFVGAMTLQPVKWHYKEVPADVLEEKALQAPEEAEDEKEAEEEEMIIGSVQNLEDVPYPRRVSDVGIGRRNLGRLSRPLGYEPDGRWWKSASSLRLPTQKSSESLTKSRQASLDHMMPPAESDAPKKKTLWKKIVDYFDFDLLKDPGFRIILFGMCLAFSADVNFSLITPVILGDRGFDISETAQIMSYAAVTDIIARIIAPYIGESLKLTARWMLFWSLVALIIIRTCLTFSYSYLGVSAIFACMGFAKGFRTVYLPLVVPNYVPLEKLASASGQQTVLNGLIMLLGGPLLGVLRDRVGDYNICIHAINSCLGITCIVWTVEYVLNRAKEKRVQDAQT